MIKLFKWLLCVVGAFVLMSVANFIIVGMIALANYNEFYFSTAVLLIISTIIVSAIYKH